MALMALSCQWSRARLCACAVGLLFHGKEARQRSLPPPLSDSVWKGTVLVHREEAGTRAGVEKRFYSFICDHPALHTQFFSAHLLILALAAIQRAIHWLQSGGAEQDGKDVWLSGQEEHSSHHGEFGVHSNAAEAIVVFDLVARACRMSPGRRGPCASASSAAALLATSQLGAERAAADPAAVFVYY